MRRLTFAMLAITLGAAVGLAACGGAAAPTTAPAPATPAASAGASAAPSSAPGAAGDAVTIAGFAFAPVALTVKVGATVTWTNSDSATHTVTPDDGSAGSDRLAAGATYTRTFDTAGTFAYHCSIHPSMKATVVVQP